MHTMEYHSAIKKNETLSFAATWMDLEKLYLMKSVRQRKTILYDIIYMWNLKIIQMNLYTKQKQTQRHRKQTYGYQRGEGGRDK